MSTYTAVLSEIVNAAKSHGVIPDVLDSIQNKALINLFYGSKKVEAGAEYSLDETQQTPKVEVTVPSIQKDNSYTLLLTDPDAPRRGDPTWSEYAHYLVTDIKLEPSLSDKPQTIDLSKAKELLSYVGPAPPANTSLHRYVFLLLEGSTSRNISDRPNWGFGRPGAGVKDWLEGQTLTPVGINFFVAQRK